MKLSLILEAIDRASGPTNKAAGALSKLGAQGRETGRGIGAMNAQGAATGRTLDRLGGAGRRMGTGIANGARRGVAALSALERRLQFSDRAMGKLAFSAGSLIGGTIRGGVIAGATAAAGLGIGSMVKVVTAGIEFENFRAQIDNLEGSAAKGKTSLDWITKFAAKTPYQLAEVTKGFIDARHQGIDPMNGSLQTLGDAAGAMHRPLEDAIYMLGDATRFSFERAVDFGINSAVKGNQVTLSYITKAGKQASLTVKKENLAVQAATLRILQEKYGGGMELLSRLTEGKWSNIMDKLSLAAVKVWDGGVGPAIGRALDRFGGWLDQISNDGSLDAWAKQAGQSIGKFIDDLSDPNGQMRQFARDVKDIAVSLRDLIGAGAKALNWMGSARSAMAEKEKSWGGILGALEWQPQGGLKYIPPGTGRLAPQNQAPPRKPPASSKGVPFFSAREPQPSSPTGKPPEGKVAVHISTDPGVRARVRSVQATGMDLAAMTRRGTANIGPA